MSELTEEIEIGSPDEMLAFVVANIFLPKSVEEDTITYSKEVILSLMNSLDIFFQEWYNVNLNEHKAAFEKENNCG